MDGCVSYLDIHKALVDAVYLDFLHTKLLGVLGDSFVKRSGSEYRKVYDDYKNRAAI